jgi:hypothetical protein
MSLRYKLTSPVNVGDLAQSIQVSELKLVSISLNYTDVYTKANEAILSVCMIEPSTGYPVNVVYQDASALSMARTIEAQIGAEIFQKLAADGKLPAGTLSTVADPETTSPLVPPASPEVPAPAPAA